MYSTVKTITCNKSRGRLNKIEASVQKGMLAFNILSNNKIEKTIIKNKIVNIFKYYKLKMPLGKINLLFEENVKFNYASLDFPIFMALLKLTSNIEISDQYIFIGDLNLKGDLVCPENILVYLETVLENKNLIAIFPKDSYNFIKYFPHDNIMFAENLQEVIDYFSKKKPLFSNKKIQIFDNKKFDITINHVKGQDRLIRSLIIAIAGKHHILIKGPIGSGKTFTVEAIKSILPNLDPEKFLYLSKLYNFYYNSQNLIVKPLINKFDSNMSLSDIFGSANKKSYALLSTFGYMFFDEFNLFSKPILEELNLFMDYRTDKENHPISTSIIACANPCPCGNFGRKDKNCKCSAASIHKFNSRISKALMDRFSICINIDMPSQFDRKDASYDLEKISKNINRAWKNQEKRYNNKVGIYNGNLNSKEVFEYIYLEDSVLEIIKNICNKYKLSHRQMINIIKLARTIADLEDEKEISDLHIYEAVRYQTIYK